MRDGVVDELAYDGSDLRLLFVLKDPNAKRGGWSLVEVLRGGGRGQTWNGITRWVVGIRNLPQQTPWSAIRHVTEAQRRDALRSIVALNLKKSPGGGSADRGALTAAVNADRDLLARQFRLYRPDVAVCCGVGDLALDAFGLDGVWETTERGVQYTEYDPDKLMIRWWHPQARTSQQLLFYGLVDAIAELRGSNATRPGG